MRRLEDDGQQEMFTLMIAFVCAVRATWPLGRAVVNAVIKQMAGIAQGGIEQIIAQAHVEVQQEVRLIASTQGAGQQSAFESFANMRGREFAADFEKVASPKSDEPQQPQHPIPGQHGYVALPAGQLDGGQQPRPHGSTDGDTAPTGPTQQTDEDALRAGVLVSTAVGKCQLRIQEQDPTPDDWLLSWDY